ncbi:MAG: hypothetical protein QM811_16325 [Pirellulales bacterium]
MIRIVASNELSRELETTEGTIEFIDANGKSLGTLLRPSIEEDVRIAKQRLANNPKFKTTPEVLAYLESLVSK